MKDNDIKKIEDLKFDDKNFNRHTQYGQKLLEDSLRKFGAGRSILIDKNGKIVAGNGIAETAADIGIDDIIIVKSDGTKLVAVQRTDIDLDTPHGREMALADNQTSVIDIDIDEKKVWEELGEDVAKAWSVDMPEEWKDEDDEKFPFALESSANINTNPRTEQTTLTVSGELYRFYKDYFDGIVSIDKKTGAQ